MSYSRPLRRLAGYKGSSSAGAAFASAMQGAALPEAEFGGPQDVEGHVVGDDVYIVQTRSESQ